MKPKAPKAPDPVQTAGAQTASNIATAIGQQSLNSVNQVGPGGSVSYNQTGTTKFTDPTTGKVYDIPQMTQTTSLSPGQQAIYDGMQAAGGSLSGQIAANSNTPFSLDNDATESRLLELGNKRLDPQLAQAREREIARLSNQGVKLGSTAYDRAMGNFDQRENDARNQLLLTGRQQAVQEAVLERNQPIQELLSLINGQNATSTPSFGAAAPQTALAGTDVAGITNAAHNADMQAYGQQMGQWNSGIGGLFSLGGSALQAAGAAGGFAPLMAGMFSDERLKKNIKSEGGEVGGVPVKSWEWKGGDGHREVGVIAQELEKKHPELVDHTHPSGFRRVNYDGLMRLGATARRAA